MLNEIVRWSGVEAGAIPPGTDGCGIPCFGLPLAAVARAFRRFGASSAPGPARILDAISAAPGMIAGERRLCSALPEVTDGRIVSRVGAEGVYGAVVRDRELGVAVEVEDASRRAVEPVLIAGLAAVGALSADERAALAPCAAPAIRNTRGEAVGTITFDPEAAVPAGVMERVT